MAPAGSNVEGAAGAQDKALDVVSIGRDHSCRGVGVLTALIHGMCRGRRFYLRLACPRLNARFVPPRSVVSGVEPSVHVWCCSSPQSAFSNPYRHDAADSWAHLSPCSHQRTAGRAGGPRGHMVRQQVVLRLRRRCRLRRGMLVRAKRQRRRQLSAPVL